MPKTKALISKLNSAEWQHSDLTKKQKTWKYYLVSSLDAEMVTPQNNKSSGW